MSTKQKFSWSLVLSIVGLLAGWGAGGCRTYAQIESRLSTVEQSERTHSQEFKDLRDDVREIRGDVKHLLERR